MRGPRRKRLPAPIAYRLLVLMLAVLSSWATTCIEPSARVPCKERRCCAEHERKSEETCSY
jgi:hypothetical protein